MPISGNCIKCGIYRASLHRDHIIPRSLGGSDEFDNIQLLCANCHQDKTANDLRIIQNTPSFKAARSARKKEEWAKPEFREKMKAAFNVKKRAGTARAKWNDPDYRAQQHAARNNTEYNIKRKGIADALWADPEYRAKQDAAWPARRAAPKGPPKKSAAKKASITALWKTPEFRAKQRASWERRRAEGDAWLEAYKAGERDYLTWKKNYDVA